MVSRLLDVDVMRQRIETALRKVERGEDLTEQELMVVQWSTSSDNYHTCYGCGRVGIVVRSHHV